MADASARTVSLTENVQREAMHPADQIEAPEWQRQPHALRDRLTEREIDAGHALVRFVGLDAYEAAGGGISRDLFAQDDRGVYVTDVALLETLVRQKLDEHAATVKAEAWAWVNAAPVATYADLQVFQRAPRERRNPTKRESDRMDKLETKMQAIGEAIDAALEGDDEEKADALQEEGDSLGEQLQALEDRLLDYAPNVKAAAGAIVAVVWQGVISEWQNRSFNIEISRRGFRTEEPNGLEPELSVVWPKVLSDLWQERISRSHIARQLHLPESEIEQLLFQLLGRTISREGGAQGLKLVS